MPKCPSPRCSGDFFCNNYRQDLIKFVVTGVWCGEVCLFDACACTVSVQRVTSELSPLSTDAFICSKYALNTHLLYPKRLGLIRKWMAVLSAASD